MQSSEDASPICAQIPPSFLEFGAAASFGVVALIVQGSF